MAQVHVCQKQERDSGSSQKIYKANAKRLALQN